MWHHWVDAKPSNEYADNKNDKMDVCMDATDACRTVAPKVAIHSPEKGIYSKNMEGDKNKEFRITTVLV